MLQKFKNRFNATRFEYTIHVHSLQPWPGSNKAIAIGWQRGKRRRGATNSVFPLPNKDKLATVVRFNEKFSLTSTLYKGPGADRNSQTGPFKKKCLILAVLETDGRTHATAALGRIVIDLSEFASIDGQELRTFAVACNKSIHAAVGDPQLTLTIRCRWKKAGADMTEDEVVSMSTDTTGSNLTANLRDFFSRSKSGKASKRQEEQDLKGFQPGGDVMPAIGEEEHEDDNADGGFRVAASSGGGAAADKDVYQEAEEVEFDSAAGSVDGSGWGAHDLEYAAVGALHLHDDDDYELHVSASQIGSRIATPLRPSYGREMQRTSSQSSQLSPAGPRQLDRDSSMSAGRRWRMEGLSADTSGRLPRSATADGRVGTGVAASRPPRPSRSMGTQTGLADFTRTEPQLDDVSTLQDELLMAAAMEFALYSAQRPLLPGRVPSRLIHAPARRVARTLVTLGRQDGLPFGHLALRQVSATVIAGRSDTQLLAFWWSNAVHLRGFMQSLNLAMTQGGDAAPKHWATEALVPRLLQQEKFVFDELVSFVWTHTFVPAVAASRARAGPAAVRAGVVKRAGQEAALRQWIAALEAVAGQLRGLGSAGHITTLRHQVLLEVMKRMDTLIFHFLVTPSTDANSEAGSSSLGGDNRSQAYTTPSPQPDRDGVSPTASQNSHSQQQQSSSGFAYDPLNPNMPMLDDSMLFFTRGVLMFGTGMNLKMACTRFQQWAFGEGGMREIWANLPAQGQTLFPLLRSAADLLMMPKDLLLEEGIRADICDSLPLSTLVYMLDRFQPDDFSREGIPFDVLTELREQAAAAGLAAESSRPPQLLVEGQATYYSPTDDMAMEKVEIGEEPGLEYGAESEEELDALSGLCTDSAAGLAPPLRFKLLHNLWDAGVPRSRRITIVRPHSADESDGTA